MKRIWEWLLQGMTICSIVIFFLAILTDTSDETSLELKEAKVISSHQDTNGDWHYVIDTSETGDDEESLCFYTNHQRIRVFFGEELLYERTQVGDLWGETLGCIWNFVPIPSAAEQLDVYVEAVYEDVSEHKLTFYRGNEIAMVQKLIRDSLPLAVISGLIILSGFVMIVLWFALRKKASIGTSLLYLGCVALILGGWCYNETDFAVLTIPTRMASSFMAYMFLLVLPPAFLLFIREFLKIGSKTMSRILTSVTVAEYALVLGMHFLGIRDARENLFIIHAVIGIGVLYVVICLVLRMIRREVDRRTKLSIIGFGILMISALADISSYYINLGKMFYFTTFGLLMFILLMGWEAVNSAISMMKKGAMAEEYEKMATMDVLTGLYNRNAYERDALRLQKKDGLMIVTFDMNELKRCNDMLGHRVGDKYIVEVAHRIEGIFEAHGKSYRIGGDEFCCIVNNAARCPIEKLITKVEDHDWVYANEDRVFVGGVASGYALYAPQTDGTLEAAREKADTLMYRRKTEIKERWSKKD